MTMSSVNLRLKLDLDLIFDVLFVSLIEIGEDSWMGALL